MPKTLTKLDEHKLTLVDLIEVEMVVSRRLNAISLCMQTTELDVREVVEVGDELERHASELKRNAFNIAEQVVAIINHLKEKS